VGIANLAAPKDRDALLQHIHDSGGYFKSSSTLGRSKPKGLTTYEEL
jgi:hypothetical protein